MGEAIKRLTAWNAGPNNTPKLTVNKETVEAVKTLSGPLNKTYAEAVKRLSAWNAGPVFPNNTPKLTLNKKYAEAIKRLTAWNAGPNNTPKLTVNKETKAVKTLSGPLNKTYAEAVK